LWVKVKNPANERTMTSDHLPPPLETSLAVVREWLDKITAPSTNPDLDLRNLRAVLIHLFEIVEQDRVIDAATDNLSETKPQARKDNFAVGMNLRGRFAPRNSG